MTAIIILSVYILSILIVILSIRYDDDVEWDNILLLIFCPFVNTAISIYETMTFFAYINDTYLHKVNNLLIKLIKYKRK